MDQKTASSTALYSLAMLKANWDRQNRTYLDSFLPFVLECVKQEKSGWVSLPELQVRIATQFGLTIPQGVLKSIVSRGSRTKVLELSNQMVKSLREQDGSDFTKSRNKAVREQNALVQKFVRYVKERYGQDLEEDEAETLLLAHVEVSSLPILKYVVTGEGFDSGIEVGKKNSFLIGSFIDHLCGADPEGMSYLETLVKGSMLAGYLYMPDPGTVEMTFKSTSLVLDTAVSIDALGFHGSCEQECAQEWLQLAHQLGADLVCLRDTVVELDGILEATQKALREPAYSPMAGNSVYRTFYSWKYDSSDVALIRSRLEQLLRAQHIRIEHYAKAADDLRESDSLTALLQQEVHYAHPEPREHDLKALLTVNAMREGRANLRLEKCGAVFVTNNNALARAALKFLRPTQLGDAPLAMTATDLCTIMWLKRPLIAPDLPRKRLVADCYAALRPDEHLWKAFLDEAETLRQRGETSADDYYLLRYSLQTDRALMEQTLGEPDRVTEDTVQGVLKGVREAIRKELKQQLAQEAGQAAKQETLPLDTPDVPRFTGARESAYEIAHRAMLTTYANRAASVLVWVVRIAVSLVLAAGLVLSLPVSTPAISFFGKAGGTVASIVLFIVLAAYSLLAFANVGFGFSLHPWFLRLEARAASRLFLWLVKVFVPSKEEHVALPDLSSE